MEFLSLTSDRVVRRLAGRERAPSAAEVAALPAVIRIDDRGGLPVPREPALDREAARLRLTIPSSIQALREAEPGLAAEWRMATRAAFEAYLGRGYRVEELVRPDERSATSEYVLALPGYAP